jgi:cobalt/nickel transport system ATP-binding protein
MNASAFSLTNVSYAYHEVAALSDLTLTIPLGRRVALLGANGSGKSTLLRILAGLYFPDCGAVAAFGEPLDERRLREASFAHAFRRRVGLVFQNPDVQLFNPTVFDELAFGPLQLGWHKDEIRRRIDHTLVEFGLSALRDRAPHRLSGGEKKRVALASVLITEPEVLLLDEPTAALDPHSQGEVVRFLLAQRESNRTIVTATHDLDLLAAIAEECFVLREGRLAGHGTPAKILGNAELLQQTQLLRAHWHVHADSTPQAHLHAPSQLP